MEEKVRGNEIKDLFSLQRIRKNPWILATFFLILIVIFLVFAKSGFSSGSVSKDVAAQRLVSFASAQGITLENVVVTDKGSFYEASFSVGGQESVAYLTKDGEYIIQPQASLTGALTNSQSAQTESEPVSVDIGNSPSIGNLSAKVSVIEFSDFSCPYCAAASGESEQYVLYMKQNDPSWEPAVPGIMEDYVQTGKVRFSYMFSYGHSGGKPASLVGWCLNEQELFWQFYDIAFAHQSDVEDLSKMKTLAQDLGADMTKSFH